MPRIPALLLAFSLAAAFDSNACSIVFPPPDTRFNDSAVVVLAAPKAISYQPKEAKDGGYEGRFRQTVLWEVLVSWKGSHQVGVRFTTRDWFSTSVECTSRFPVYGRNARLLYLSGREPYDDFYSFSPEYATHDFRYLETIRAASQDGT